MATYDTAGTGDDAINDIRAWILSADPTGDRIARVFRATFDQLYDGQHTGRYALEHLYKTEKTHFGTLIEINLQREFEFPSGDILDYRIAGHEVDCKFSHSGAWMLPQESFDKVVLTTQADDYTSVWSVGLVRVTDKNRRVGLNQDRKSGLSAYGRAQITWLYKDKPMPPNVLLSLDDATVDRVMSQRSGQARINELFRSATDLRISRNVVATVAQQEDYMKRVRGNGGARSHLQPEGILILSGDYVRQRETATLLGTVEPQPGEFVSVRVRRSFSPLGALIDGDMWVRCSDDEQPQDPSPLVI
ncbi:NaeI family type II restriction endonuclease [Clavibacter michiganensis]|uniref:NaeI family type II restriction endonuclease n=1 Tax=Clavibacter michiganensis TaxID=28447 RepID=UPI003EBD0256